MQASNSHPEDEQTNGKASTGSMAASRQTSGGSSAKTSNTECSFDDLPTIADSSAEASLIAAFRAYNSHVQSAGQRQMEDILRRLLDQKFPDFQQRRENVEQEGWLSAVNQLCWTQDSLVAEMREVRLQLSRLERLHHHAIPASHSVMPSFNFGTGDGITQLEQSLDSTASAWDRYDNAGWMGGTTRPGNTHLDAGSLMEPYLR